MRCGQLQVFLVLHLISGLRQTYGSPISTCASQQPCLRLEEGRCIGGSRTLCLAAIGGRGCALGLDTVDTICTISSTGRPVNILSNSAGQTCGVFAGGSTARFAISDDADSSGSLAPATIQLVGGTSTTRTGACSSPGTTLCTGAANTNTIWTFPVSSCSCTCQAWSSWGTCGSTCTRSRSRTCTAPTGVTCTTNESEKCTGGSCLECSCAANWSSWSTCSSSCQRGVTTRSKKCVAVGSATCNDITETKSCSDCFGCNCAANWSSWSTCSSSCQGGVTTRSKKCVAAGSATCNDITETKSCSTTSSCIDVSTFRCHCGGWTGWTGCSSSCGKGTHSRSRKCEPISGGPPNGTCPAATFPTSEMKSCTGRSRSCPTTGSSTSSPPIGQCDCTSWATTGGCLGKCGTGQQRRTRSCKPGCPSSHPRSDTITCNTGKTCQGSTSAPTGTTSSPTGSSSLRPGCNCTPWVNGACSITAGCGGTLIQHRNCNVGCTEIITRIAECHADAISISTKQIIETRNYQSSSSKSLYYTTSRTAQEGIK